MTDGLNMSRRLRRTAYTKNVEAAGLKYPVEDIYFSPIGKIGTSNVSTAENIKISYKGSGMLGIFSSRYLDIFYNSM